MGAVNNASVRKVVIFTQSEVLFCGEAKGTSTPDSIELQNSEFGREERSIYTQQVFAVLVYL